MQDVLDMIYYPDDYFKTICALVCFCLIIELIFGVISLISHAVRGGR